MADVGGAGSDGQGEENIKIAATTTIVEMNAQVNDACDAFGLEALPSRVRNYKTTTRRAWRRFFSYLIFNAFD